jgi:hypothetical protein
LKEDFVMRQIFVGLLLLAGFCAPAAWPKDRIAQAPIFMAPAFHFSDIDRICTAPTIDLRSDKDEPLLLSGSPPSSGFLRARHEAADDVLAHVLTGIGYETVHCNPVSAILDDLQAPPDSWLRKLDFGESRWLFIVAVEFVSTPSGTSRRSIGLSHAVVSGYLFAKRADGAGLVWRDKVVGGDTNAVGGMWLGGSKSGVELVESERAIADGIVRLLGKFETRKKSMRRIDWNYAPSRSETEDFDVTCSVLWAALNDTLKTSGKYEVIQIDNLDMMAIYTMGYKSERRADSALLAAAEHDQCSMEVTDSPHQYKFGEENIKTLSKRVREALSK